MRTDYQERTSILCVHLLGICYDGYDFFNTELPYYAFKYRTYIATDCDCSNVVQLLCDCGRQLFRVFGSAAFVYCFSLWKVNCQPSCRVWAVTAVTKLIL
jgi:hypothetical protein